MDDLKKLSFTEICFLYFQEQLEHCRDSGYSADRSQYYKEILSRLGVDLISIEECIEKAKELKLITEAEGREIATAIRIKSINEKALDKLKEDNP